MVTAQETGTCATKASGLHISLPRQDVGRAAAPALWRFANPILVMETLQKQLVILSSLFLLGLLRESGPRFLGH